MPKEREEEVLNASEYTMIRAAVSELIEGMDGIDVYYGDKDYCEINRIAGDSAGVGLFDLQGAKYLAKYIDGSFMAQYPFSVLLRTPCTSDAQNLTVTDFMDRLGAYLEQQRASLDGGRTITDITQTVATFENTRSDSGIITLQANFLLKYRKDD